MPQVSYRDKQRNHWIIEHFLNTIKRWIVYRNSHFESIKQFLPSPDSLPIISKWPTTIILDGNSQTCSHKTMLTKARAKTIVQGIIQPNARLSFWFVFVGMMLLTMNLYAPFIPPPSLAITRPTSNTVTVTIIAGNPYNYALQMSTNVTGSPWTSIRTNYSFVAPVVFTNIPASNTCEFFRMVTPPS